MPLDRPVYSMQRMSIKICGSVDIPTCGFVDIPTIAVILSVVLLYKLKHAVILSGVWCVLCTKRSRRTCGCSCLCSCPSCCSCLCSCLSVCHSRRKSASVLAFAQSSISTCTGSMSTAPRFVYKDLCGGKRSIHQDEYRVCSGNENWVRLRAEGPLYPSLEQRPGAGATKIHRAEEGAEKVAVLKGRGFSHAVETRESTRL
jgi:hypothetical protein